MWIGIILALLMNNTILYKLGSNNALIISISVIGIVFGVAGIFFHGFVTILASSVIGSYMMIRPLGWFIGEWPNEFTLVKMIKYKIVHDLPIVFYLYAILFTLLAGLGLVVQFNRLQKENRK